MDADRRRRIAQDLLDAIDAVPVGVDGPGDFDLNDLVATMKLETALIGECTDAIERAHAVEKMLDGALVALGGWRHITLAERQGDAAEEFYRAFRDPTITRE
jgi:hypothetical protein